VDRCDCVIFQEITAYARSYNFRTHVQLNVVRVNVLLAAAGYVKVNQCSVRQTANRMIFHHGHFFDASLCRLNGKEVQFRIGALAQVPVDECHCCCCCYYYYSLLTVVVVIVVVVKNVTASATRTTTFLLSAALLLRWSGFYQWWFLYLLLLRSLLVRK